MNTILPLLPNGEPDFSPLGAAYGFVAMCDGSIKYVRGVGWYVWGGKCWHKDNGCAMHVATRKYANAMCIAIDALATAVDGGVVAEDYSYTVIDNFTKGHKWLASLRQPAYIKSYLKLAADALSTQLSVDQLDSNPDLICCLNGVVDLKNGKLLPHDRSYYYTTMIPVEYHPGMRSHLWDSVVERLFDGNSDKIRFFRRYLGYCLTGHSVSQALLMLMGSAGCGKSIVVELILHVMSGYAYKARTASILRTATRSSDAPTPSVLALRGKRLVALAETERGQVMATAWVKDQSGSDTVNGRGMYQSEAVTFRPTHKLLVYGNHPLVINDTDEGIWRRINMLKVGRTIPAAERDLSLEVKLRQPDVLEGVLAWLVQGASDWYQQGLAAPQVVVDDTNAYRFNSDLVGLWMADACLVAPNASSPVNTLYKSFAAWLAANGEGQFGQRWFVAELEGRQGVTKVRQVGSTMFTGIALKGGNKQQHQPQFT